MKEEKMTPVSKNSWTNPSIGTSVSNDNISKQVNENTKEINELRNEVKELKEEISKLTPENVETPVSPVVETPKEEVKEEKVEMPFESPFTEAVEEPIVSEEATPVVEETPVVSESVANTVQEILNSVKEDVKETPVEETSNVPSFDDMLVDENKEKVSVVVNRYNTDIEATTKGKGAKFIALTEAEHNKLKSGKING